MTPRNAMYWIHIGLLAPPVYGLLTLWATLTSLLARAVRKGNIVKPSRGRGGEKPSVAP